MQPWGLSLAPFTFTNNPPPPSIIIITPPHSTPALPSPILKIHTARHHVFVVTQPCR